MATNTYVALDKVTANGSVAQITFTSIPTTYTDLVVVVNGSASYGTPDRTTLALRVGNGSLDTTSIYSQTGVYGNGSTASSSRGTGQSYIFTGVISEKNGTTIVNFQNYSNTTTYKTILSRGNSLGSTASQDVGLTVGLWRSTSAINTIQFYTNDGTNYSSGTTFSLYGIKANTNSTTKANGGVISSDATYWYHTFGMSGTFTPTQSLTADILVIAGGGGGGNFGGGGGGAGGLLGFTSQSLTATGYTVTVGAGGTGGAANSALYGTSGSNSQFGGLTACVGGGRGGGRATSSPGTTGGSGGGNAYSLGSLAGTSGQGYAGGAGTSQGGGGGGGAGEAGNTDAGQGDGGDGVSTYSSWGAATSLGQNISGTYWFAGGGGGFGDNGVGGTGGDGGGGAGSSSATQSGLAFTGSGGGATSQTLAAGNGGSGIVIVRYAK
jgi:hypothetical protein